MKTAFIMLIDNSDHWYCVNTVFIMFIYNDDHWSEVLNDDTFALIINVHPSCDADNNVKDYVLHGRTWLFYWWISFAIYVYRCIGILMQIYSQILGLYRISNILWSYECQNIWWSFQSRRYVHIFNEANNS